MIFVERIKHMVIAVLAVLSLFASSISACTCSHHVEQAQVDTASCHSHSHQTEPIAQNASPAKADAPCECVLVKPAPAIVAKSEKKKLQLQNAVTDSLTAVVGFERRLSGFFVPAVLIDEDPSTYLSGHFTGLLPSRAPPRL